MHDGTGPLSRLSADELTLVDRFTTRYSRLVLKHAHLVGLMVAAGRRGDLAGVQTTQREAAKLSGQISQSRIALAVLREELTSAARTRPTFRPLALARPLPQPEAVGKRKEETAA